MEKHLCHARTCGTVVDASMFMCPEHWNLLPADLRRKIYRHYRNGERPSQEWTDAAAEAQDVLEQKLFERCIQLHGIDCGCWKKETLPVEMP